MSQTKSVTYETFSDKHNQKCETNKCKSAWYVRFVRETGVTYYCRKHALAAGFKV